jgi:hypothetical protein
VVGIGRSTWGRAIGVILGVVQQTHLKENTPMASGGCAGAVLVI